MKFWPFGKTEQKGMSTLDLFREIYGGRESQSGVSVSWSNAIEVATVLACVRVIANGVAQIPWRVYQEQGGAKQVATEHPLNLLIYRKPNADQTSFAFRETMMLHLLLTGNFYAWKGMVGSDRKIKALEPLEPNRVSVERKGGRISGYVYSPIDGPAVSFRADDIWHVRGPSWDTLQGMDAVKLARDAIGLSIKTEQAQADLHKNGSKVSGLLSMDGKMSQEQYEKLLKWMDMHATGGQKSNKPLILDNGVKFTPYQMTGVDAQHLETRKHQIEEICRAFGVMPIMIGHADKTATYASAEQMFLAHVVHTLMPHYERIEQSADINLLSDAELSAGYYTKFTPNALMRGASQDRAEFYTKALGAGGHGTAWMTTNEVRGLEELDAIEGGDKLNAVEPTPDTTDQTDNQDQQTPTEDEQNG